MGAPGVPYNDGTAPKRRGRPTGSLSERFWAKVDRRGRDECWPWLAKLDHDGYGRIRLGGRGTANKPSHRVAWELDRGEEMPTDRLACHSCNFRACNNPKHIYAGTTLDNARDCAAAGREKDQRGSKHALTRLTESDVLAMRVAYANGDASLNALAVRYGIRKSTASYIVNGRTWAHVPMPLRKASPAIGRADLVDAAQGGPR